MKTINITKEESQYAISDGEVYGVIKLAGGNRVYVYVELGQERPYNRKSNDDINTEYKFFSGCTIFYAKTEEDLNNEIFIESLTQKNISVKLCF